MEALNGVYNLDAHTELRFQTGSSDIFLQLLSGSSEVMGTEMVCGQQYLFRSNISAAVSTFEGCQIKITGRPEFAYVSQDTNLHLYANIHAALEQLRARCSLASTDTDHLNAGTEPAIPTWDSPSPWGPRVMVCGPSDVGKTSLALTLVNYAARSKRTPLFVDLDVSKGTLVLPGALGAAIVDGPLTLETLDPSEAERALAGPVYANGLPSFDVPACAPLALPFGHLSPEPNVELYLALCERLAALVCSRCAGGTVDPSAPAELKTEPTASGAESRPQSADSVRQSGLIINTCSWLQNRGFDCLVRIAQLFAVNVVLVLDQEWLVAKLKPQLPPSTHVLLVPKSRGAVVQLVKIREDTRGACIRRYFNGPRPRLCFFPRTIELKFSDMHIFKIGAPRLSNSLLPIGLKQEDESALSIRPVRLKREADAAAAIANNLLAVVDSSNADDEKLGLQPALGFLLCTQVDLKRNCFSVLSPNPPPLPRNILLVTYVSYIETS